jgi:energy-coupling factor transporter ATP-binding protein EcfA2
MTIQLSDIKFGEIDAKNEEFQQVRYGSAVFANAFQVPPRVDINELLLGAKFFITGQKGCGKTALLLHTRRLLSEQGAKTHTVLFKTGLNENERQQIAAGSGYQVFTTGDNISVQYEYVTNWLWLIYRNLIRLIDLQDVEDGYDIARDLKSIMGVKNELRVSPFSDLAINKVKLSAKAGLKADVFNSEIAGELELASKQPESRTPLEIIDICERYIHKIRLHFRSRCLLFFDELELFWSRPDQKERDLFLIRDLLQSVARVNRNLGASSASFVVYASVRSEVLEEVNRVGPEIARDVQDFGAHVDWNVRASSDNQPILQIVEAKIHASEIESDEFPTKNVWETYFPDSIHGRSMRDHLLDVAMFKPRNIVSRLNLAKMHDPSSLFFTTESLEETNSKFSASVWREMEEEMLVIYSPKQVRNLKSLLTGFRISFNVDDFEKRLSGLSQIDPSISDGFRTRADIVFALSSLYRIGALGNRFSALEGNKLSTRDRWVFREHEAPTIDENFVVHESLRKVFQLGYDI